MAVPGTTVRRREIRLDAIDWPSLYHAYGYGGDVPDLIWALYSDDADRADKALGELFNHALHQGSVYPATVAAVPFLAHAAVHALHGPVLPKERRSDK